MRLFVLAVALGLVGLAGCDSSKSTQAGGGGNAPPPEDSGVKAAPKGGAGPGGRLPKGG